MTVYFNDLVHYLSIHCLLKASSHVPILMEVRSDRDVTISIDVWVPTAVSSGEFMYIPWLGTLLDWVSPLCGGRSLSRLDTSYLVDADFSLWRVLNVDVHQGRVERCWKRTDKVYTSGEFIILFLFDYLETISAGGNNPIHILQLVSNQLTFCV